MSCDTEGHCTRIPADLQITAFPQTANLRIFNNMKQLHNKLTVYLLVSALRKFNNSLIFEEYKCTCSLVCTIPNNHSICHCKDQNSGKYCFN